MNSTSVVTDGALAGTPTGTWTIDPAHSAVTFSVIRAEFLGLDETGLQGEPRIGFSGRTTAPPLRLRRG
jgi:polyisoprenoid-binding protein YceI